MCGIGGVWGGPGVQEPGRIGRLFAEGLTHRGPDGEGFLAIPAESGVPQVRSRAALRDDEGLRGLLVHRRLSIIDLNTGAQPMGLADGSVWIVYNGEIYNYPDLKREIAALEDDPFVTTSDTEVILRIYRRWGVEGLRRLNGMFAFGLYDTRRRELILARDPVGVKPLYWTQGKHGVAFASEIRPLLAAGLATRNVAPTGLAQYLFYRFVPAPATLWCDVFKVSPGHALRFDATGRCTAETDFAAPAPARRSGAPSGAALAAQLQGAVRRQLLSDVPVGAFLSGGLDSSILVAAIGDRTEGFPTFAVGFAGNPDLPSELDAAERAARALQTRHAGQELDADSYADRFPWAVAQVEEPLAHPGMLLQSDLAELARRELKVVLTGQGADEPLGGYPRHQAARVLPLLAGVLGPLVRSPLLERLGRSREWVARVRQVLSAPRGVERAAALFGTSAPQETGALVSGCGADAGREAILGAIRPWWERGAGLDDIARVLYVDVRTSLADDLLLVGDKMCMAHSLEARVPYLDLDYLAALEAIPGPARVPLWGPRKRIQLEIGRRLLPPSLARGLAGSSAPWRRKRGFDVPVAEWFRGRFRHSLPEFLTGRGSFLSDSIDAGAVNKALQAFLAGRGRGFRQILAFFMLEHWLRFNLPGAGAAAPQPVIS